MMISLRFRLGRISFALWCRFDFTWIWTMSLQARLTAFRFRFDYESTLVSLRSRVMSLTCHFPLHFIFLRRRFDFAWEGGNTPCRKKTKKTKGSSTNFSLFHFAPLYLRNDLEMMLGRNTFNRSTNGCPICPVFTNTPMRTHLQFA